MKRMMLMVGGLIAACELCAGGDVKSPEAAKPEKERVLFLAAHPDDIISSVGTCLLMREKFEVHVVDFTHGEHGLGEKGFPDVFYDDITSVAKEKERLIRLYVCQNTNDGMCVEEMQNSSRRALRMWPFRMGGYAEAFAPYVGRPQGSCIFAELPRDPEGAKMPTWGR